MTSHSDDDPLLRNPRFDRLWREASAEEPAPALDDALRAAARRAVAAGPQRVAPAVEEATRPERWWFPLAAAATIGAVAFGLLQIVGREHLTGETAPGGVVSDVAAPAAPPRARAPTAANPAPEVVVPPAPTPQALPAAPAAASLPIAPAPAHSAVSVGASKPTAARNEAQRADAARPPAAEPAAEVVTPRPAVAPAPAPPPAPATAAAHAPVPFPGALAKEEQRIGSPAAAGRPLLGVPGASPAPASPPSPAASATQSRSIERSARTSTLRSAPAADGSGVEPLARERTAQAPLPVAEWIALIRRLRDEGRLDDAKRELVAFRMAHPDHARLLPPDLRDWAVDAR
jgi:hypothetical protein